MANRDWGERVKYGHGEYGDGEASLGSSKLDRNGWPIKVVPPTVDHPAPPVEPDQQAAIHKELKRVRVESVVEPSGKRGKRAPRLPTREELAALALDVYRLALDHKRAYVNRVGDTRMIETPDFKAACEALKVAAHVAGLQAAGSKAAEAAERAAREAEEQEQELDAEGALDRLRANIAKQVATPLKVPNDYGQGNDKG